MTEPLFTLEQQTIASLTPRQAHALKVIEARQPIKSDDLGCELHAYRKSNGGHGHSTDSYCDFCTSEGRDVGDALARKGLVRYARGAGWMTVGEDVEQGPSSQVRIDDPWPKDCF